MLDEERSCAFASTESVDGLKPLIPDGEYTVEVDGWETTMRCGKPKLVLHCRIIDYGQYLCVPLQRWYNINRIIGKPRRKGTFHASGFHSDLVLEFVNVFGEVPKRLDRIPLSRYLDVPVRVRVRSVGIRADRTPLPGPLQYSVIDEVLGVRQQ